VAGLTRRELEVLRLLADGHTPKTVARILDISVHTTRGHIKNVLWKLGEHSQLGAVAAATRLGLLERSAGPAG
jgi:DNA-binding CsgD family transcriptional regulator